MKKKIVRESKARYYHSRFKRLSFVTKIDGQIKPDIVIQLAAVARANRSNKDPFSTFDHSFRTLENALDACKNNIEHFIYFSSSMVYGNFEKPEVDEDTHCNPLGIYAALKFGGEKLVISYNQVFDLPYTIIRPSLWREMCKSKSNSKFYRKRYTRTDT